MINRYRGRHFAAVLLALGIVGTLSGCTISNTAKTDLNSSQPVHTEDQIDTAVNADEANDAGVNLDAGSAASSTATEASTTAPSHLTTPAVKEFTMTAKNWEFSPAVITVNRGDRVRIHITSVDVDHGFAIAEFNVSTHLTPGKTETVEFTADKAGSYTFFCNVFCGEGHRSMKGTLVVK